MAATALADLNATAVTSRCHNPYFRREQLKSLHDTFRKETDPIRDALLQDTNCTDIEATIEVASALRIIKQHYSSIEPNKELKAEYTTAEGNDGRDRAEPWGVVCIEPALGHTPFLSVTGPLSAAIAAGSCVALKLENTSRTLPSLLRKLLPKALQADTFQIIPETSAREEFKNTLFVLQGTRIEQPTHAQLVSSSGRVIALVDRTADLSSAAEALVEARFSCGGTSPYAPNLILVNEFAKKDFIEHVLRHAIRYIATTSSPASNETRAPAETQHSKNQTTVRSLNELSDNKNWDTRVITQGSTGAIVELVNRHTTHVPLPSRSNAPILAISAVSSLDHAIDLIASDSDERLSAAYHFAAPAHGKYLSQFIPSEITFVNHIPPSLLLGPGAPLFHEFDVEQRYRKEHFLRASPVFVRPSSTKSLADTTGKDATRLLKDAAKEIKEPKRAEWIAIGFFEQGILIGLGVYGVPLLTCLGASLFFGIRAGLRKLAVM